MLGLSGKIAFVTGGGSGIGRAISKLLAREGARVIVADINGGEAKNTVNLLTNPSEHFAMKLDVTNPDSVREAFQSSCDHYGSPPLLLAQSAGITRDNFLHKLDEKQFMDVLDVNLKGTFLVQKEMVGRVLESAESSSGLGAAVVNIASVVGKHGNMGQSNYAASKAGVVAFTKTTAKELGKKGIRVNCVMPGFIETPMVESVPSHLKDMLLFVTPLQRFGKPDEVAEVVCFLLSSRSSYVTGATVEVTGGFGM